MPIDLHKILDKYSKGELAKTFFYCEELARQHEIRCLSLNEIKKSGSQLKVGIVGILHITSRLDIDVLLTSDNHFCRLSGKDLQERMILVGAECRTHLEFSQWLLENQSNSLFPNDYVLEQKEE